MVKVILGNNVERKEVIVNENTTLKACLEANGIDYARGSMHLDGATLGAGELNKTFAELGVAEKCYLLNVAKADNA